MRTEFSEIDFFATQHKQPVSLSSSDRAVSHLSTSIIVRKNCSGSNVLYSDEYTAADQMLNFGGGRGFLGGFTADTKKFGKSGHSAAAETSRPNV